MYILRRGCRLPHGPIASQSATVVFSSKVETQLLGRASTQDKGTAAVVLSTRDPTLCERAQTVAASKNSGGKPCCYYRGFLTHVILSTLPIMDVRFFPITCWIWLPAVLRPWYSLLPLSLYVCSIVCQPQYKSSSSFNFPRTCAH
jgi:hypothetical protein